MPTDPEPLTAEAREARTKWLNARYPRPGRREQDNTENAHVRWQRAYEETIRAAEAEVGQLRLKLSRCSCELQDVMSDRDRLRGLLVQAHGAVPALCVEGLVVGDACPDCRAHREVQG